jgi:hypothetical protein
MRRVLRRGSRTQIGGGHFFKSKKKDNTRLQNNKSNLLIQIRML